MNNNIFTDLEIDYTHALSDPERFAKDVYEAAESLKTILRSNHSVQDYIDSRPKNPIPHNTFHQMLDDIYSKSDELEVGQLQELANMLKEMAKDIEKAAYHRATFELTQLDQNRLTKQEAHHQYCRLRESFNMWATMMRAFSEDETIKPLPPMPGNYGSNVALTTYVFIFEGEDDHYINWHAVNRKLGLPEMNRMDTVDYIRAHPELKVTVSELVK
jgi:hypothetical protein